MNFILFAFMDTSLIDLRGTYVFSCAISICTL